MKTKNILLNLALFAFAVLFSLIIGEVFFRTLANVSDKNAWVGAEKKFYEYDALLGWRRIPNTETIRVSIKGRNSVLYRINSKGIRGPEYTYNKDDDEYRILFLGDSFADGYMIEFNKLFSEVLKNQLNDMKKDKYYETINAGTSGWSTDQELLFFENEGKKYNPDLTVLMFYQNDINYNNQPKDWGMYYKPLFKIKKGELLLTNVPVPRPDVFIIHDHLEQRKTILKKLRSWLNVNSYLYRFVKERVKSTYIFKRFAVLNMPDNDKAGEETLIPLEYRVWEKTMNDAVLDSWEVTEAMLVRLQKEAASIGSKLLVFYIPFEGSIYDDVWKKLRRSYNLSDDDWSVDQAGIILRKICARNNIDLIDPTGFLRKKAIEVGENNERIYDSLDHHWSVNGHKIVGDFLAEYIDSEYLRRREYGVEVGN